MSSIAIALILAEIVIAAVVIWAFMNEEYFINLENRLYDSLVQSIRDRRGEKEARRPVCEVTFSETSQSVSTYVA